MSNIGQRTRNTAYRTITENGTAKTVREKVYDAIANSKDGLTRNEIEKVTGLRITSVCGRVKELLNDGKIIESGVRKDVDSKLENAVLVLSGRLF